MAEVVIACSLAVIACFCALCMIAFFIFAKSAHHPSYLEAEEQQDAAARRLQLADYYRETYRSKPDWQGI